MPKPHKGEKENEYISRCMASPEMNSEFPDSKQRAAVCYSYWKDKDKVKNAADTVPDVLEGAAVSPGGANTFVPELGDHKKMRYQESDFIVDPNVALFDAHDGREEDVDIDFDENVLKQICENTNRRINDTGDASPIYCGHLQDELPESEQGELLGFATNFRMGEIGKLDPRPCILADMKWLKSKYEKAKEYPRRSVELWLDDMVIDCVAALKRRPQRNLGLLFQKNIKEVARYSYELKGKDMADIHIPDQTLPEPMAPNDWLTKVKDELVSYCKSYMDDMKKREEGESPKPELKKMEHEDEHEDVKVEVDVDEDEEMEPAKLKASYNQNKRNYAKLLESHKALEARLVKMEHDARVANRRADLVELEATENLVFDMGEELTAVADLSDEDYQKHVTRMKKNYSKAPIGVKIEAVKVPETNLAKPEDIYNKLKYQKVNTHEMLSSK